MSFEYVRKMPKSLAGLTAGVVALGSVAGCGAVKFMPNDSYPTSQTVERDNRLVPQGPILSDKKTGLGQQLDKISERVLRSCGLDTESNPSYDDPESTCLDGRGQQIDWSTFSTSGDSVTNLSLGGMKVTVAYLPNGPVKSVDVQDPDSYEQFKAGEITTATIERMDSSGQKSINPEYRVCLNMSNLQADYVTWEEESTCANSSENPNLSKKVLDLLLRATSLADKDAYNNF